MGYDPNPLSCNYINWGTQLLPNDIGVQNHCSEKIYGFHTQMEKQELEKLRLEFGLSTTGTILGYFGVFISLFSRDNAVSLYDLASVLDKEWRDSTNEPVTTIAINNLDHKIKSGIWGTGVGSITIAKFNDKLEDRDDPASEACKASLAKWNSAETDNWKDYIRAASNCYESYDKIYGTNGDVSRYVGMFLSLYGAAMGLVDFIFASLNLAAMEKRVQIAEDSLCKYSFSADTSYLYLCNRNIGNMQDSEARCWLGYSVRNGVRVSRVAGTGGGDDAKRSASKLYVRHGIEFYKESGILDHVATEFSTKLHNYLHGLLMKNTIGATRDSTTCAKTLMGVVLKGELSSSSFASCSIVMTSWSAEQRSKTVADPQITCGTKTRETICIQGKAFKIEAIKPEMGGGALTTHLPVVDTGSNENTYVMVVTGIHNCLNNGARREWDTLVYSKLDKAFGLPVLTTQAPAIPTPASPAPATPAPSLGWCLGDGLLGDVADFCGPM